MSDTDRPKTRRTGLLLAAPCLLVLLGFVLFSSTGRDDSHITYFAAWTLADHGAITNYSGERVEQSSSLTLVVTLAALVRAIPAISLPTLAWLFSIGCGAWAAWLAARRSTMTGLLVATNAAMVYWAFSGMETTLTAGLGLALVGLSASIVDRTSPWAWLAITLVAIAFAATRPENILALPSLYAGWLAIAAWYRQPLRRPAVLLALGLLVSAGVTAFRAIYFGQLMPEPVTAKSQGLSLSALHEGGGYVFHHAIATPSAAFWIAVLAGGGLIAVRACRREPVSQELVGATGLTVILTAFVLLAGGDWMEAGRFLVPIAPVGALLAVEAVNACPQTVAGALTGAILIAQLAGMSWLAGPGATGSPLWATVPRRPAAYTWVEWRNAVHRRDAPTAQALTRLVGRMIEQSNRPVTILSGQMGLVSYYVARTYPRHVRIIDRFGLASRDVVSCLPANQLMHSQYGFLVRYEALWSYRDCLGQPDVIFDINAQRLIPFLVTHGYRPVFEHHSEHDSQVIAVRLDRWSKALADTTAGAVGP